VRADDDFDKILPLTSVVFEIMIALAEDDKHGYAIMMDIEHRTNGAMKIRPGSLYRAISRMVDSEWIEEADRPENDPDDDERRRYYRMTKLGRRIASAEAERLAGSVAWARDKKLLGRNA
jgi:DNA-binding PadR family transcriptional regulator